MALRDLHDLDPYQFERLVAGVWAYYGWETTVRSGSGDRGIDIEARKADPFPRYQALQVKQYRETKLTSDEVRRYRTLYDQNEQVDSVGIVTTGAVTDPARELADDLDVAVMDGSELVSLLTVTGLDAQAPVLHSNS